MLRIIYHIIMNLKTIKEIAVAWLEYKRPFVKDSTFAAYALTVQNHIVPAFGESCELPETDVQQFVLQKLANGISVKTIKDILIVLKMVGCQVETRAECAHQDSDDDRASGDP